MNENASIALTLSRVTASTCTSPARRCRNDAPPRSRTGAGVPEEEELVEAPPPPRPPPNLEEDAAPPPRPPVRIWLRKAAGRAGLFWLLLLLVVELVLREKAEAEEGEFFFSFLFRVPLRFFPHRSMPFSLVSFFLSPLSKPTNKQKLTPPRPGRCARSARRRGGT